MEKPTDSTGSNTATAAAQTDTFRKRRLSYPRLHLSDDGNDDHPNTDPHSDLEAAALQAAAIAPASPPPEQVFHPDMSTITSPQDKAHTFRKRRLSLTSKLHEDSNAIHPKIGQQDRQDHRPKRRRSSVASTTSAGSAGTSGSQHQPPLLARTVHATELLPDRGPPPSPFVHNNILYQHYAPIPPDLTLPVAAIAIAINGNAVNGSSNPVQGELPVIVPHWKTSHHLAKTGEDDHKLPFPRDIVGTYSCHGAEPVYDSGSNEDNDEDSDDGDNHPGLPFGGKKLAVPTISTKPTTVAKINQDRGGVAFPYGNSPRTALFAVYDGHGQGGELVSQYALHEIQRRLEKHSHFRKDLVKAFKETFLAVDSALETEPGIEPVFAGTTACVALLKGEVLTCANAGDSRAVVAVRHPTKYTLTATDLTIDQNPDLPEEMKRILQQGGYVSPPPAPGLSARVWLDPHCTQIGLAMARSIGDHAVSAVGVIAEPVVTKHTISPHDEFLILASDGVWEFISSQEAVDIVGEHLDRGATKACQALIEAAAAKWHEEEGDYRDDITALVVCLQDLWTMSPSTTTNTE